MRPHIISSFTAALAARRGPVSGAGTLAGQRCCPRARYPAAKKLAAEPSPSTSAASDPINRIAGRDIRTPRTEASDMNWNVLDSTAHRSPESPVPSSNAPGTAPIRTAGRPPRAASHNHSAPVSRGTNDEKDHHCEVMDSRTALSSRLFFSRSSSPIEQPFPDAGYPRPIHSRPSCGASTDLTRTGRPRRCSCGRRSGRGEGRRRRSSPSISGAMLSSYIIPAQAGIQRQQQ